MSNVFRDFKLLAQPVPLDGAQHAAAQALRPGSQEDGLGRMPWSQPKFLEIPVSPRMTM